MGHVGKYKASPNSGMVYCVGVQRDVVQPLGVPGRVLHGWICLVQGTEHTYTHTHIATGTLRVAYCFGAVHVVSAAVCCEEA